MGHGSLLRVRSFGLVHNVCAFTFRPYRYGTCRHTVKDAVCIRRGVRRNRVFGQRSPYQCRKNVLTSTHNPCVRASQFCDTNVSMISSVYNTPNCGLTMVMVCS